MDALTVVHPGAANPRSRVLLIEAGRDVRHPLVRMPLAWTRAAYDPRFNWGYVSDPDPALGRRLPLPRGKMLGGTSSINALQYSRGSREDYDAWRDMGNGGWGYSDVLPYFRKMEDSWRGENALHGVSGPLGVRSVRPPELGADIFQAGAHAIGHETSEDIHGECQQGLANVELMIDARGRRPSAAAAYLHPVRKHPNLTIRTDALAARVSFEGATANGVIYDEGSRTVLARSRRVILSCGANNSPKPLVLSGVGQAGQLTSLGLAVVKDLPAVGMHLKDHPIVPMKFAARVSPLMRALRLDRAAISYVRWLATGGGLFATNGNPSGLFAKTRPGLPTADVQLIFASADRDAGVWLPWRVARQRHNFICAVAVQHPESSGSVTLRTG